MEAVEQFEGYHRGARWCCEMEMVWVGRQIMVYSQHRKGEGAYEAEPYSMAEDASKHTNLPHTRRIQHKSIPVLGKAHDLHNLV